MDEEHIEAYEANIEIGNYDMTYCDYCARELDIYETLGNRYKPIKICLECKDNY